MSCFNNGPETYITVHLVICGMVMQDPYRMVMTGKISKQKFTKTVIQIPFPNLVRNMVKGTFGDSCFCITSNLYLNPKSRSTKR